MPKIFENMKAAGLSDAAANAPVREALTDINTSLRDVEGKIQHRFLLVLVLAATFELARRSNVEQFSLFGITISGIAQLRIGIPVVIAGLTCSIASIISIRRLLQEASSGLFAALYPELSKHGTSHLTIPLDAAKLYRMMQEPQAGMMRRIYAFMMDAVIAVFVIFPPVFVLYALGEYALDVGMGVETIVAIIVSVIFLAQIPFVIVGTMKIAEHQSADATDAKPTVTETASEAHGPSPLS